MILTALAIAALIAALCAGSVIVGKIQARQLWTLRAAGIVWLACVMFVPFAVKTAPDWCEGTRNGSLNDATVALGAIIIALVCGAVSRLLSKHWLPSIIAGGLATIATFLLIAAIINWLPGIQPRCSGIY